MNHYLDIGVVQIQPWLAKAPSLKGRRGASTMIRRATEPATIDDVLAPFAGRAWRNPEVGAVDGVVSLVLATGDDGLADEVGYAVVRHLRERLPHAMLRVTRAGGEHYATRVPGYPREWPPPLPEWPLARPCAWCRTAPAHQISAADENAALCVECLQRSAQAGTSTGTTSPGPEQDLLALYGASRPVPDDFDELCALSLGPPGDDTHLATVYADGNAIGAFIDRLKRHRPELLASVPKTIHDATWASVLAGLSAVDTGQPKLPLVPHLVGGDDILVSLPAHGAWDFVDAAITTFSDELAALDSGLVTVSLSAGVVFHHHTFPLSATVELAAILLKQHAKGCHPGVPGPAIAWHSVTHDGVQPTHRPPVRHGTFAARREHLAALAGVVPSQRQYLARLQADLHTTAGDMRAHLDRMDLTDIAEPFLGQDGIALADALAMVRWWRA